MKKMRAVQLNDFRKPMTLRDIGIPEIDPEDALVRVTASGSRPCSYSESKMF